MLSQDLDLLRQEDSRIVEDGIRYGNLPDIQELGPQGKGGWGKTDTFQVQGLEDPKGESRGSM
jgi:hypothetical protein